MRFLPRLFLPLLLILGLAGCQSQDVTDQDKKFLLRGTVFQNYDINLPADISKMETFSKTGYYDSTYDLDYEFRTPENAAIPLYLNQSLAVADSSGEAVTQAAALRGGTLLGLKTEKIAEKPMANERIYGDGSKLTILTAENGQPFGNVFSARKNKRVYFLIVSGLYFDSPEDWDEFAGENIRQWLDAPEN